MVEPTAEPGGLLRLGHWSQCAILWPRQRNPPHPARQDLHRAALPLRICLATGLLLLFNMSAVSWQDIAAFLRSLACWGISLRCVSEVICVAPDRMQNCTDFACCAQTSVYSELRQLQALRCLLKCYKNSELKRALYLVQNIVVLAVSIVVCRVAQHCNAYVYQVCCGQKNDVCSAT